jgi:serine/threonine-protein kinase
VSVQLGTVIARKYRVERILGEGGMGVVVSARDRDLDRRVAIKLLRKDALAGGAVERFMREARAAASLDSPHVARVLEVGRARGGEPFIVLEHLDGEDLHARCMLRPPRKSDAVRWILEACEGLAAAHARGIIHRDLKPSNLFLARQADGSETIKLLDFGLAKNPNDDDGRITATGAILGSPSYMSPEHLSGRALDVRSDVWSLGVTLYELLTRALPFPGRTTPQICAAVLSSEPMPIDAHRPDVPRELERVIESCLAKDPAGRPATVAELAAQLEPFAGETRGSAERIARTLAAPVEPLAPNAAVPRDVPTHLVSALDAVPRERTSIVVAVGVLLLLALSALVFVFTHRSAPPVVAVPSPPSAPAVDSGEPLVLPTVTAVAASSSAAPRTQATAHVRPIARPRPSASHDPLERF